MLLLRRTLARPPVSRPFTTRASKHTPSSTFLRALATMATDPTRYKLNHSMIRVKDPMRSVEFYEFLGMKLLRKLPNPDARFDLYFLAYDSPKAVSHANHWTDREGIVELTHNYGTEDDPNYKVANGNQEPHRGFGHLCISVDNLQAACQRLGDAGYKFQKKLTDGRMRHIAFVLDPDGYWVEVIGQKQLEQTEKEKETDLGTYRMNHTMIRVKDAEKSVAFYKDIMGMQLKRTSENEKNGFNLYFLGYGAPANESAPEGVSATAHDEGLLELTWNYGTEKDANFKYHNGNDEPQGFGHICVSVDDLDAACARFEEKGVNWKKRLTEGRMKNIAFVLDPDGYWIEVVQNEKLKQRSNCGVIRGVCGGGVASFTAFSKRPYTKRIAFRPSSCLLPDACLVDVFNCKPPYHVLTRRLFPNINSDTSKPVLFFTSSFAFSMAIEAHNTRPKILIPEKVSPDGLALLKESFDVDEKKGLSAEQLKEIIGQYEALIVRSETKVTAELLGAAKKLKVVARAGVGVDNVDVKTATSLGIIVVNSPSGNINAAAEHTIALLMSVARNVADASQSIKAGKWERSRLTGIEAKGKTLAIVGLGKVGLTVARIANGFGMRLIAYDPYANESLAAAASVILLPNLADLLTQADFLTLHTPLIASTKGMISRAELATMKPTARILNVARGGMIDEDALVEALDAGTIAGAGIDVFTSEPPQPDSSASRLIAHTKVVATPHLGASTKEAQENVSIDVCEQVVSILSGELPRSAVNAPIILPEEYRTLQPFVTLLEKMGSLYTQHYSGKVNAASFRTTFDITYEGALAELNTTKPLFAALVKGLLSPISETLNINIVNAELVAKERGILINEQRSRENVDAKPYSSFITLRARASRSSSQQARQGRSASPLSTRVPQAQPPATGQAQLHPQIAGKESSEQVIQGFISGNKPFISRLDRFSGEFVPQGTLLICRNFDSVGKIGYVGNLLGKAGVNIKFMNVAPLHDADEGEGEGSGSKEALMILGVEGEVTEAVRKGLISEEGALEASLVVL
ncbi:phosphoglycerate dehydrogenase [Paraphaeosphaeria minitans]|uniref:Multifunctional fusion protein n=1 Tax=Paraphaeosphaeria minitans TaxID=565426 RepID=A0A9P6G721_9PLEO|nr:phosphoglycerate dehydrogenase [Paraphaeosphaeria minitans]